MEMSLNEMVLNGADPTAMLDLCLATIIALGSSGTWNHISSGMVECIPLCDSVLLFQDGERVWARIKQLRTKVQQIKPTIARRPVLRIFRR